MKGYSRIGILFWFVIGIYVLISSLKLGLGDIHHPGPGFIFFCAASLLIVFNVIDLVVKLKVSVVNGQPQVDSVWQGVHWRKVLIVLCGLASYVFLLNFLGFLLSTFVLILFLLKSVEPVGWIKAVVLSLIITMVSYAIFSIWLKVPFPEAYWSV